MLERKINQLYAHLMGFFWIPCPFPGCGKMFGGHETGKYTYKCYPDEPYRGKCVCKRHDDEYRKEIEAAGITFIKGMKFIKPTHTP